MKRLAGAALLTLVGFVAGAIAMLELLDRLFGGTGIRLEVGPKFDVQEFADRWSPESREAEGRDHDDD